MDLGPTMIFLHPHQKCKCFNVKTNMSTLSLTEVLAESNSPLTSVVFVSDMNALAGLFCVVD